MPKQTAQTFKRQIRTEAQAKYLLYLPSDYSPKARQRWPLMLFLHGMGERGANLAKVKMHGPPKLIQQGTNLPFIVVSPQCPLGKWWEVTVLNALLDEAITKYRVDPDRIYLTGLSMGGFGSFELALHSPERFAAVVPVCGGGAPFSLHGFDARRKALKRVPFWVFHGANDPVVPVVESDRMVRALKEFGCDVKFTVYPGVGHDSWTRTYENPDLVKWFLLQRRSGARK